jgi:PAT family beta-lactamase induction signal transducer AmpG
VLAQKLAIIAWVYVIEGFPMAIYADVLPVFLRRHDVSLAAIGALSGLSIAWSAKVLWSPLVDRYGDRRQWIAAALGVMAICLGALTTGNPVELGALLWISVAVFCAASATQDIAIDAYTIGLSERGDEGPINTVRVIAYRAGQIAAGGGLLLAVAWIGWGGAFMAAALLTLLMAVSVRAGPAVPVAAAARRDTWLALRRWLARPHVAAAAAFILLYRVGDRAMGPMVRPFWIDRGFSDAEIGIVTNTLGHLATAVGAVAGGISVARLGIGRSLWLLGALALASNLAYAAAALSPDSDWRFVYAASLVESLTAGLASVGFLSFLMRLCEKERAAVQYALLTATYALSGSLVAIPSGWIAERTGYAAYFALTALLALPAFAFLPRARRLLDASANGPPAPGPI